MKVKGCELQMVCARASHAGGVWDFSAACVRPKQRGWGYDLRSSLCIYSEHSREPEACLALWHGYQGALSLPQGPHQSQGAGQSKKNVVPGTFQTPKDTGLQAVLIDLFPLSERLCTADANPGTEMLKEGDSGKAVHAGLW